MGKWICLLVLLSTCMAAPVAVAESIAPDEGYLLLAVDTNFDLRRVEVRNNHWNTVDSPRDMTANKVHYYLYKVKAGTYWIGQIQPEYKSNRRYFRSWREVNEMRVVAGQINYPGTLIIRINDYATSFQSFRHNRATQALHWMESHHADLMEQMDFKFEGAAPDGFAQYLKQVRQGSEP